MSYLQVDISDLTFATSVKSDAIFHDGKVIVMPYAMAIACDAPYVKSGSARLDLCDIPFVVANTFVSGGFKANAKTRISHYGQLVELRGGGFCSWIAPLPVYNLMFTVDSTPFKNKNSVISWIAVMEVPFFREGVVISGPSIAMRPDCLGKFW